jgi:RIO kinase 1
MNTNYYDYSSGDEEYDLKKHKNVIVGHNIKNTNIKIDNELKNIDTNEYNRSFRIKDKSDRATVEQVLDSRISKILYKLINKGEISQINGCISTGKEANVYYAVGQKELAIKIYKTSILIFKDRERYIAGEFRFRHGYCKSNPRKMVALWAEKEVRNLKRLQLAGIKCPNPLILKSNLIVMEFIGKDSVPAPRLKDAIIDSLEEWETIYISIVNIMRVMFKKCKLVHADFSEYNILYYCKEVYIIDVAQAIEDFHINALSFLKRDCANLNTFFERIGVNTITNQQLFEIVSSFELKISVDDLIIKFRLENYDKSKVNPKFKIQENGLFNNFEIPRTLKEEDVDKITSNWDIEEALTKLSGVVINQDDKSSSSFDEENEEDENQEINDLNNETNVECKDKSLKKTYDPFEGLSKCERKKKVKEDNRERRKNKKLTKYEKNKLIKKTSHK